MSEMDFTIENFFREIFNSPIGGRIDRDSLVVLNESGKQGEHLEGEIRSGSVSFTTYPGQGPRKVFKMILSYEGILDNDDV
jgi:hypothetical protein